MKESLLLVFANKQDIPGGMPYPSSPPPSHSHLVLTKGIAAMKPAEVTEALKLSQLKDKIWFVVPSCATTGEGLLEGLVCSHMFSSSYQSLTTTRKQAWLSNNVKSPPNAQGKK
jgi:ADP-ribosylation factor protein 6